MKTIRYLWPVTLTTILLSMSLLSGCQTSDHTLSTNERFQGALDEAVSKGLPGVSVRVAGKNIDFSGSAGVTDLETQEPTTVESRFYVASIGKTFIAATMVQMASDALFSLDDGITQWLPESITSRIPSSDLMSIRMLLNHTTGIFDFQNDAEDWDNAFLTSGPDHHWSQEDTLPFFLDKPLHFEPGSNYSYSNSNYILAALIIESASGEALHTAIRNRVIEPLGLTHTLHGNEAEGVPGMVHGYFDNEGEKFDSYLWYNHFGLADGGIQTTAEDLAKFIVGLLTSNAVLDDAMRAEMLQPSLLGTPPSQYGLGISIRAIASNEEVIYSHNGKDPGYQAEMLYFENRETVITLCANGSFDNYDEIVQELMLEIYTLLEELQE